jgi:hypothetical protein
MVAYPQRNHLPHTVVFQLRINPANEKQSSDWVNIGTVSSGESLHFPLAKQEDEIEFRIKVIDNNGFLNSDWSSSVSITAACHDLLSNRLELTDNTGTTTYVSVGIEFSGGSKDHSLLDQMKNHNDAARVVFIYVPSILVDCTGQKLEFLSGNTILREQHYERLVASHINNGFGHHKGLSNVQENKSYTFDTVHMIGNTSATLAIRQTGAQAEIISPWSASISFSSLKTPKRILVPRTSCLASGPLVLSAKIQGAPKILGGKHTRGT